MKSKEPVEIKTEFLSVHGLNSFVRHNSSSRSQMFSSHITQFLVINGCNENKIQTGVEQEFAKYTLSTKMPENGKIIKVIDKYTKNLSEESINFNPESLVIYEDEDTKEIGCFTINHYKSYHQHFGFKNKLNTGNVSKLTPGAFIPKDTIFADSPTVTDEGGYSYGINLNMALMSHPAASEDGIVISESTLDKLKFNVYETRVLEFGNNCFPLNLYGTINDYKPFPDIGEYVRDDGLLAMTRNYDMDTCPVTMSVYDTLEPDHIFDKGIYGRAGKGKVIDIKIYHDENEISTTPTGMEGYLVKYLKAKRTYYKEILNTEKELKALSKKKFNTNRLRLKPELHRLIVEALSMTDEGGASAAQKLNHLHRKSPLDDYRVEFTIEYEITPDIGYKMTDKSGGKGVIVLVMPDKDMPVDQNGLHADIIMDPNSTLGRMNLARIYETYVNSVTKGVETFIINNTIGNKIVKHVKPVIEELCYSNPDQFNMVYNYLLKYYSLINDKQYTYFNNLNVEGKIEHITDCIVNGIILFIPPDNDKDNMEMVKNLEKEFPPTYGKVTYTGISGNRVTTVENIRIAPLYMLLLEKIGDEWASVSSGRLQNFGILSPVNKGEKYSLPYRNNPVRVVGETEGRLYVSYAGRQAIAEIMDRNNNPTTHKAIVKKILNADKPTKIYSVVDRNILPLGSTKPLQIIKHIFLCSGWKLTYKPEKDYLIDNK